jgi:Tfp pilus assembly protein PilF
MGEGAMGKHWGYVTLAALGLLPQLGCISTPQRSDTAALVGAQPDEGKAPTTLPPAESARASLQTAQALEKEGHLAEAALQYERARHFNPRQKNVARRLALIYDRLGLDKQAQAEYEKALAESPRDANLINNFGFFHYSRGKFTHAEEHFRKALALDGKHKAAWSNLGLTLAQQERYPESMEAFHKVVGPAEAFCNLAFVLTAQGKREEAKQAYQKALQLEPELPIAHRALAKLEGRDTAPGKSPAPSIPQKLLAKGKAANQGPSRAKVLPPSSADLPAPGHLPNHIEAREQLPDLPPIYVPEVGNTLLTPAP